MQSLIRALTTNSTSTGFTAQTPTATEPSGAGVFNLADQAYMVDGKFATHIFIIPFGTDGNDDTFDFRVWGYHTTEAGVYVPQLLVDASVILGNISGAAIASGTFMADTLTQNDGSPAGTYWSSIVDSQEDLVASIIVSTRGAKYIKWDWDLTGGQEAVSMNAYFKPLVL